MYEQQQQKKTNVEIHGLPGGKGPLMKIGIIGGGPLGGIPLGGIGGRIGMWGCICGGGASPRLKKLLEISTGGGGKARKKSVLCDIMCISYFPSFLQKEITF